MTQDERELYRNLAVLYCRVCSTDTGGFQFHQDLIRLQGIKFNFYRLERGMQLWHYESFCGSHRCLVLGFLGSMPCIDGSDMV